MSQARTVSAGPPRKRFLDQSGITLPPDLNASTTTSEFTTYSSCLRHGRLRTNLCERCLASYAGHLFNNEDLNQAMFPGLADLGGRLTGFILGASQTVSKHSLTLLKIATVLLKGLWILVKVLAQVSYSCIVCFMLMWFVQPSMTPAEQARRDKERDRKRREDDAWRARRDADHEARRKEELEWFERRDAEYEKSRKDQDEWRERRDADYTRNSNEQVAWEKKRDEDYRRKVDEYKKWDDERIALAEASSITAKMGNSNSSVANDARLLDEIKDGVSAPEVTKAIESMEESAVDKRVDKASDSIKNASIEWKDVVKRDTKDGSRVVRLKVEINDAVNHLNDADDMTRNWKKR